VEISGDGVPARYTGMRPLLDEAEFQLWLQGVERPISSHAHALTSRARRTRSVRCHARPTIVEGGFMSGPG